MLYKGSMNAARHTGFLKEKGVIMRTGKLLSGLNRFGSLQTLDRKNACVLLMLVSVLFTAVEHVAAQAPDVTIDSASDITATSATINGTINPHTLSTGFHVIYGPTTAYGYTGSYAPVPPLNTPVTVSNKLTGLSANTTYHCQLVATNASGIGNSADMTFTTLPSGGAQAPVVTVNGATSITSSNATISGTVNPNGSETGYFVQWGLTTAYGGGGPVGSLPAQNNAVAVTAQALGMSASTTYHYRLAATNSAGTVYSADMMLTTSNSPPPPPPPPPAVTTGAASPVSATNATINGTVNPNGAPTSYYFQWGTTTTYGNVSAPISLPAQNTVVYISLGLTGLTPATTYHYQLVATNTAGSTSGADQQFTTPGLITINGHAFTYTVTNGTVIILSYSGPGGNVTIPSTIDGLPVIAIGNGAFSSSPSSSTPLTGITFPASVTSIGDQAFYQCGSLTKVVIPDSVTNLGDAAFCFCGSLSNLTIGKGITTIRGGGDRGMYGTFLGSGLTRLYIPDNVTNISNGTLDFGGSLGAFWYSPNLTNVVIGKGLAFLGAGTFSYCGNLVGVYFEGNAPTPGASGNGEDIFYVDPLVTLYYLPGTTGWGSTYATTPPIPAVLWNPQSQSAAGGMAAGTSFGFNVVGTADIPIVIEASANPGSGSWVPLQTCTLTNGSINFSDPDSSTIPARVYRIRSP
jgi:hypothetical protein